MAGQLWSVDSLGGRFYSLNLSKELRVTVQPMLKFAQFADVKDATMQGKQNGQTFTWDKVGNVGTQGRNLTETNTMPESNFLITQGTLTISEAGNSIPYTGMLEALSQFSVREPIMKAMRNDSGKFFDILNHAELNKTLLRVTGSTSSTITTNTGGTATNTNSMAFNKLHHKLIMDFMRERNIPSYTGDDYVAVAWPSTYRQLKNDIEAIHQYTPEGLKMIFNGEIGRFENCRFIEQTNIPKGGAADSTTWNAYTGTADAWNGGFSDWIFFCGEEVSAEAICVPLEMRAKIPTDYGRSKGVAWYWLGGYGLVYTDTVDTRVVKWDSAV
jgi:N4-gp56 family major capsid protein